MMKLQVCPLVWHFQYTDEVKTTAGGGKEGMSEKHGADF